MNNKWNNIITQYYNKWHVYGFTTFKKKVLFSLRENIFKPHQRRKSSRTSVWSSFHLLRETPNEQFIKFRNTLHVYVNVMHYFQQPPFIGCSWTVCVAMLMTVDIYCDHWIWTNMHSRKMATPPIWKMHFSETTNVLLSCRILVMVPQYTIHCSWVCHIVCTVWLGFKWFACYYCAGRCFCSLALWSYCNS